MDNIFYISCFRFSIQLMISEAVFLIGKPKKKAFGIRLTLALLAHVLFASGYYFLLSQIEGNVPVAKVCFWMGLFLLTLFEIGFCYDLLPIEILFIGTGGYATEHIAYGVAKILQYITGMYVEKIGVFWENLIFRFLIYILVAVIIYYAVVRKNKAKGEIKPRDYRLVQLTLLVLLTAIVLSVYATSGPLARERNRLNDIVFPMYSLLCCLMVIIMEYYVFRENRLNRENETMEQLLQIANAQQESSREAIDIINMKCHDLKHQMKALMKVEDAKERSEYIEEMRKAISIYDATYHTGCESLDYLLREKSLLCDEYHIAFSCMVDGDAIAFMHPADIYALMGNALDNAMECVIQEEHDKRIISLRIRRHGQMVSIHLENTCSKAPQFQDDLPVTNKTDKNYHGFGVRSIRYVSEKYNGNILMRAQEGRFYLDVLIPEP